VAVACVRANVTVRNTTGKIGQAIVYGPPFALVHHIWPPSRLRPTNVVLQLPHAQQTYLGFVVSSIGPHTPAHLILRFEPPRHPQSIVVATKSFIRAKDRSILQNSRCTIRRLP